MLEQMNINLKTYKKPKSEKRFYDEENKVNHPLNFPIYNKGSVETFPLKQSSALSFKDTTDSSIRFISNRKERCLTDSNNILSNIKDFVENQTKNIHFENPNFNLIKISNDNISHSSKHSRNISKEIRMKSAYLNPCSENILILKNAFERIPNFEEEKKSLNNKKDELILNIDVPILLIFDIPTAAFVLFSISFNSFSSSISCSKTADALAEIYLFSKL